MSWFKKSFSNKEIDTDSYQNTILEISSKFHNHPDKQNEFAVFKEELFDDNHILYFSPTDDPLFTKIINNIKAEACEKPNLNNAKLILGRFV